VHQLHCPLLNRRCESFGASPTNEEAAMMVLIALRTLASAGSAQENGAGILVVAIGDAGAPGMPSKPMLS